MLHTKHILQTPSRDHGRCSPHPLTFSLTNKGSSISWITYVRSLHSSNMSDMSRNRLICRHIRAGTEEDDGEHQGDHRQNGEWDRKPDKLTNGDHFGHHLCYASHQETCPQRYRKNKHRGREQVAE